MWLLQAYSLHVSADAVVLPTITVAAVIESVQDGAEGPSSLSYMTAEPIADLTARLRLSTDLQVHDSGFEIGNGDDPLFGISVSREGGPLAAPEGTVGYRADCIAEEEAL